MQNLTRWRLPIVDGGGRRVVSHAGGVLLARTAGAAGLDRELRAALAPWRKQWAVHEPGKIILDVATALALGGDCLADIAAVRAPPEVFGPAASDPTVSRLIAALAAEAPKGLAALNSARAAARARVWRLAGQNAPDHDADVRSPLVIDFDATLVTAQSEETTGRADLQTRLWVSPVSSLG